MRKDTRSENEAPSGKRKRSVQWTADVQDHTASSRPPHLFKRYKPPLNQDYDRLWQRIRPYINQNDWEGLDRLLKIHHIDENILNDFFLKKGKSIFMAAMFNEADNFRTFVLYKMPQGCALQILNNNNYKTLEEFFRVQQFIEKKGWYTEEMKAFRVKKLTFLLKIDQESVARFIERNQDVPYMTEAVQEEYRTALAVLEGEVLADLRGKPGSLPLA